MAALALLLPACAATPLAPTGSGFQDPELGYTVGAPQAPGWRLARVKGAALAFRGPGGTAMSFDPTCGRRTGPPRVMARHLRLALPEHRVRASAPLTEGPGRAWMEILDVREDDITVRVQTVTWVAGRCIFDWALAGREGFEAARPVFDAWRASFRWERPPPELLPAPSPAGAVPAP